MSGLLQDKVAIVTGATGGIGAVATRLFAKEGAKVVATDLPSEAGEALVAEIRAAGGQAVFMPVDITQEDHVAAMVRLAVDTYGRLDCAFNNVGIGAGGGSIAEADIATFQRVMTTNVIGTLLCMKYEIAQMLTSGGGTIVNTSSLAGIMGVPGGASYSASKHAVNGLTKTAAGEYGRRGIRVNAICPGVVNSGPVGKAIAAGVDMGKLSPNALGRVCEPEEVAELALWLLSPRSSYITGQPVNIDAGRTALNSFPET